MYEDPVEGYTGSYVAGGTGSAALIDDDDTGCLFEGIQAGEFTCDVTNAIDGIDIEVTKQWMGVNEGDMELVAEAEYSCFNVFDSNQGGATTTLMGTLSYTPRWMLTSRPYSFLRIRSSARLPNAIGTIESSASGSPERTR